VGVLLQPHPAQLPAYGGTNPARSGAYHQNRTPYQRMKRAGIPSKTAEAACLWTVTILDDPKFRYLNFGSPQSVP